MIPDLPLNQNDFSSLLQSMKLKRGEKIAVAVSGGADSLALTILLGHWCQKQRVTLTAITVDHGLRPAAVEEARQVKAWLEKYDIPHVILTWKGDKPIRNIQDQARGARYQLLGEWCQNNAVTCLFLAHHQDDQAETFLIRLFRGSGVDGLSAMKAMSPFPLRLPGGDNRQITLCRPLLSIPKARLVATLRHMEQPWIEDPSNQNESYTRIKVRHLLKDSEIEGLQAERLAQTAERMGRVQSLLQSLTDELRQACVCLYPEGYAVVELAILRAAHEEIALRLLAALIREMSGRDYVPRLSRLEGLYDRLKGEGFSGQTLGGCRILSLKAGKISISREVAAIPEMIEFAPQVTMLWDGRFLLHSDRYSGVVKRVAPHLWKVACEAKPDLKKVKMAKGVRDTLPCLLLENGDVILPDFIAGCEGSGFSATFKF